MLKITEISQRGYAFKWLAEDERDFCLKVISSNRKSQMSMNSDFETVRRYLERDLKQLIIEKV